MLPTMGGEEPELEVRRDSQIELEERGSRPAVPSPKNVASRPAPPSPRSDPRSVPPLKPQDQTGPSVKRSPMGESTVNMVDIPRQDGYWRMPIAMLTYTLLYTALFLIFVFTLDYVFDPNALGCPGDSQTDRLSRVCGYGGCVRDDSQMAAIWIMMIIVSLGLIPFGVILQQLPGRSILEQRVNAALCLVGTVLAFSLFWIYMLKPQYIYVTDDETGGYGPGSKHYGLYNIVFGGIIMVISAGFSVSLFCVATGLKGNVPKPGYHPIEPSGWAQNRNGFLAVVFFFALGFAATLCFSPVFNSAPEGEMPASAYHDTAHAYSRHAHTLPPNPSFLSQPKGGLILILVYSPSDSPYALAVISTDNPKRNHGFSTHM